MNKWGCCSFSVSLIEKSQVQHSGGTVLLYKRKSQRDCGRMGSESDTLSLWEHGMYNENYYISQLRELTQAFNNTI